MSSPSRRRASSITCDQDSTPLPDNDTGRVKSGLPRLAGARGTTSPRSFGVAARTGPSSPVDSACMLNFDNIPSLDVTEGTNSQGKGSEADWPIASSESGIWATVSSVDAPPQLHLGSDTPVMNRMTNTVIQNAMPHEDTNHHIPHGKRTSTTTLEHSTTRREPVDRPTCPDLPLRLSSVKSHYRTRSYTPMLNMYEVDEGADVSGPELRKSVPSLCDPPQPVSMDRRVVVGPSDPEMDTDADSPLNVAQVFRARFPQLARTEPLLQNFQCSLSKKKLHRMGRIFVTGNHICFYSPFCESVVLPFDDIISLQPRKSVFVPDEIEIKSKCGEEFIFSAFLNSEEAYQHLSKEYECVRVKVRQEARPLLSETQSASSKRSSFSQLFPANRKSSKPQTEGNASGFDASMKKMHESLTAHFYSRARSPSAPSFVASISNKKPSPTTLDPAQKHDDRIQDDRVHSVVLTGPQKAPNGSKLDVTLLNDVDSPDALFATVRSDEVPLSQRVINHKKGATTRPPNCPSSPKHKRTVTHISRYKKFHMCFPDTDPSERPMEIFQCSYLHPKGIHRVGKLFITPIRVCFFSVFCSPILITFEQMTHISKESKMFFMNVITIKTDNKVYEFNLYNRELAHDMMIRQWAIVKSIGSRAALEGFVEYQECVDDDDSDSTKCSEQYRKSTDTNESTMTSLTTVESETDDTDCGSYYSGSHSDSSDCTIQINTSSRASLDHVPYTPSEPPCFATSRTLSPQFETLAIEGTHFTDTKGSVARTKSLQREKFDTAAEKESVVLGTEEDASQLTLDTIAAAGDSGETMDGIAVLTIQNEEELQSLHISDINYCQHFTSLNTIRTKGSSILKEPYTFPPGWTIQDIHTLLFGDTSTFLNDYRVAAGNVDVAFTPWTYYTEPKCLGYRSGKSIVTVSAPFSTKTELFEWHRFCSYSIAKPCGQAERRYLYHTCAQTPNVTFGNAFRVEFAICITEGTAPNTPNVPICTLSVTGYVHYIKSTWMASKIESTALKSEGPVSFRLFLELVGKLVSKPRGAIPKAAASAVSPGKDEKLRKKRSKKKVDQRKYRTSPHNTMNVRSPRVLGMNCNDSHMLNSSAYLSVENAELVRVSSIEPKSKEYSDMSTSNESSLWFGVCYGVFRTLVNWFLHILILVNFVLLVCFSWMFVDLRVFSSFLRMDPIMLDDHGYPARFDEERVVQRFQSYFCTIAVFCFLANTIVQLR